MQKSTYQVLTILPEDTHELRHKVLRAHAPRSACVYPHDSERSTYHYGLINEAGEILAVASVYKEGSKLFQDEVQWRLRGMAVHPEHRGKRLGRMLLDHIIKTLKNEGGGRLWANARQSALGFYLKAEFKQTGELFEHEDLGLHAILSREITKV
jgi:GNAT superfamily N-acetyltransferase